MNSVLEGLKTPVRVAAEESARMGSILIEPLLHDMNFGHKPSGETPSSVGYGYGGVGPDTERDLTTHWSDARGPLTLVVDGMRSLFTSRH